MGRRTLITVTLAVALTAGLTSASAATPQDQDAAFTLSFVNAGKPSANTPVRVLPKDGSAIVAGTTTPQGAIEIMNVGTMPKGSRADVYVCTDDNGQEVIVVVQAGVDPSKDPRCRQHRRAGGFIWGHSSTINLSGLPATGSNTATAGRGPRPSALMGPPLFELSPWELNAAFGASLSFLGGVTDGACSNVLSELEDLAAENGGVCDDPDDVDDLDLAITVLRAHQGPMGLIWLFGGGFGWDRFTAQHLDATLSISSVSTLEDTIDFHVTHVWQFFGEVRPRIGYIEPYVKFGANRWNLEQAAALTLNHQGNAQTLNSSTASDSGWTPGFGFGADVALTRNLFVGAAYEHTSLHKGGSGGSSGFSEHINTVQGNVSFRFGVK